MIAAIHAATWWLALAAAVGLAGWAAIAAIARRPSRLALDRLILVVLVILGVGAVTGLALYVAGPPPADMLHLVYAIATFAALSLARSWAGRRRADPRAFGLGLAAGGAVLGGLLVRLGQTGG